MKQNQLVRRILQYILGLICMAVGLVLLKKTCLGVSPITAVPDSVTNIFIGTSLQGAMSLGNTTIMLHLLCVIGQIIVQKRVTLKSILCMCVGIPFGKLVDLFMWLWGLRIPALPAWSSLFQQGAGTIAGTIIAAVLMLFCGIAIQGFGVALISGSDLMLPAPDELNNVISKVSGKKLSKVKMTADSIYVATALLVNLFTYILAPERLILSIGISSVVSVLLTGYFVGLTFRLFPNIKLSPFFRSSAEKQG